MLYKYLISNINFLSIWKFWPLFALSSARYWHYLFIFAYTLLLISWWTKITSMHLLSQFRNSIFLFFQLYMRTCTISICQFQSLIPYILSNSWDLLTITLKLSISESTVLHCYSWIIYYPSLCMEDGCPIYLCFWRTRYNYSII